MYATNTDIYNTYLKRRSPLPTHVKDVLRYLLRQGRYLSISACSPPCSCRRLRLVSSRTSANAHTESGCSAFRRRALQHCRRCPSSRLLGLSSPLHATSVLGVQILVLLIRFYFVFRHAIFFSITIIYRRRLYCPLQRLDPSNSAIDSIDIPRFVEYEPAVAGISRF